MAVALYVLAFLILAFFAISYVIFCMTYKPAKDRDSDHTRYPSAPQYVPFKEPTALLIKELMEIPFEEVWIESFDGLKLYGRYYHVKDRAPLQIEFHGYHSHAYKDFCGGNKIAREAGYNTLLVDQRNHGKSGGKAITFGINERQDVKAWADWAAKRFGESQKIMIVGVSMGAASVLMASELDLPKNVVGVIADCPFSSPVEIICKVARDRKIPVWMAYPFIFSGAAIFGHFSIGKATPIEAVKNTKLPILLIHGMDDRFVPYEMSCRMKAANEECITFVSVPEAGHGLSYMVDNAKYVNAVNEFCNKVFG